MIELWRNGNRSDLGHRNTDSSSNTSADTKAVKDLLHVPDSPSRGRYGLYCSVWEKRAH